MYQQRKPNWTNRFKTQLRKQQISRKKELYLEILNAYPLKASEQTVREKTMLWLSLKFLIFFDFP